MSKISHFQIILFVNKKPNRLTLLKDVCLFWMLKIWASFWLFVVEIVVAVYCHADLFNYRYFSKFIFKFLQKGGICPICKPSDPPSPPHLPHQVNYRSKIQFANSSHITYAIKNISLVMHYMPNVKYSLVKYVWFLCSGSLHRHRKVWLRLSKTPWFVCLFLSLSYAKPSFFITSHIVCLF